jgi:anaerobic selenocysteine-containing dehydrogenase
MTNTWQDIKNANVVVVMGGNAAEAHPCGFKWVIAVHPHGVGRRPVRADPSGHGYRVPERRDPLSAGEGQDPA